MRDKSLDLEGVCLCLGEEGVRLYIYQQEIMKLCIIILLFISVNYNLSGQQQIGSDILGEKPNEDFGSAVAINYDGTIVAIGAQRRNNGRGVVEVYEYKSGVWSLKGEKIEGLTNNSWFGTEVALAPSGNRMVVGSYRENIVRIYDFIGNDWFLSGEILFGMPFSLIHFGYAIDISNDGKTVAISATHHPQGNVHRGIVNIYREVNDQWLQLGDGIEGEFDRDQSGWDIDLSEDGKTIAIGSISNDNKGENAGQVRIFTYNDISWNQVGESLHGEHHHLSFGWSLDMSGNGRYLVVGAPIDWSGTNTKNHYVEVYELIDGDWLAKGNKIYGALGQNFGYQVAITDDGNRIAVSVPQDKKCPIQIYDFINHEWELVGSISHEAEFHALGYSLAMNPDGDVIVGTSRTQEGFTVVYDLNDLHTPNCIMEEESEEGESTNIYFPNVINLNSIHEYNSVFFGQSNEEIVYSLSIFDRWGGRIFFNPYAITNSVADGWQPSSKFAQGVYVYQVKYLDRENEVILIGNITLIN